MHNPRLAARYAKALIEIAIDKSCVQETLQDIQLLNTICHQNKDFLLMLRSPIIKADKKVSIIDSIFSNKLSTLSITFIKLLIIKGREKNLDEIGAAFIEQYRAIHKMKLAKLTTAVPANQQLIDIIHQKLQHKYPDSTIEIETKVNPEIIGGFVLELGNEQMDASIIRDLKDVKKQFSVNLYIPQM